MWIISSSRKQPKGAQEQTVELGVGEENELRRSSASAAFQEHSEWRAFSETCLFLILI